MNRAAKMLGMNRTLLKGILIGKGVELIRVAGLLAVRRRDLAQVSTSERKEA